MTLAMGALDGGNFSAVFFFFFFFAFEYYAFDVVTILF